jgi:hypothetical protein
VSAKYILRPSVEKEQQLLDSELVVEQLFIVIFGVSGA